MIKLAHVCRHAILIFIECNDVIISGPNRLKNDFRSNKKKKKNENWLICSSFHAILELIFVGCSLYLFFSTKFFYRVFCSGNIMPYVATLLQQCCNINSIDQLGDFQKDNVVRQLQQWRKQSEIKNDDLWK